MQDTQLSQISNFIWGVADDLLRDTYVRGKYRDVILPMTVLRRLDAVLEPTKQKVLEEKKWADGEGIEDQALVLESAAGQSFYNTSPFGLKDLTSRASRQQLRDDFSAYLDGFSPNVQDILDKFEFRNQVNRLSDGDILGDVVTRFLSPRINLSPEPVLNPDGSARLPGLDNHAMGTIFEGPGATLQQRRTTRRPGNTGRPGTPWSSWPNWCSSPIQDRIEPGTYLLYDGAIGTGGMLTIAEQTLQGIAEKNGKRVSTDLYGQEVNNETYAICKADMLLKGERNVDENIVGGPQHSTLSNDAFRSRTFDFMLSNPPYGKSWSSDLDKMGGKKGLRDPRFLISHGGNAEYSLVTRTSDGQMLFLANMAGKMKHDSPLGSRIAEVHNGSSLFTGDAGQGESNIRRWIIENDWLEAIVALPLNMFYNTGIATYVWVLTNRKPGHRKGHVQLIDATRWFTPLRRNLGQKNCELSPENIRQVTGAFMDFEESEQSKIFPNEAFGYWKVTVERPLRLTVELTAERRRSFREVARDVKEEPLANLVDRVGAELGPGPHRDFNRFLSAVAADATAHGVKLTAKRKTLLKISLASRDKTAEPVMKAIHRKGAAEPDALRGLYPVTIGGEPAVVEYEPDADLRDMEQVALLHPGGIEAFLQEEVLPYAPDA